MHYLRYGVGIVLALGALGLVLRAVPDETGLEASEPRYRRRVEHVRSGNRVKLDSGDTLVLAGIRAPYSGENGYENAKRRLVELIEGKKVRLRFDTNEKQEDGDLQGYVFADGVFVNALLVEEGLVFVRLTDQTRRFADELLEAQSKARRKRYGVWKAALKSATKRLVADPKYGNFHRPTCDEAVKINPERLTKFRSKYEAFTKGYAPCTKCRP